MCKQISTEKNIIQQKQIRLINCHQRPLFTVGCGQLERRNTGIENGGVRLNMWPHIGIVPIGTVATFYCFGGFELVGGTRQRHCVDPVRHLGHWNGSNPTCMKRN